MGAYTTRLHPQSDSSPSEWAACATTAATGEPKDGSDDWPQTRVPSSSSTSAEDTLRQCKVEVRRCHSQPRPRSGDLEYDVEVKGPNGSIELRTTRTVAEFERTHMQLKRAFPQESPTSFLGFQDGFGVAAPPRLTSDERPPFGSCNSCQAADDEAFESIEAVSAWKRQMSEGTTIAGLQQWLNQVSTAGLLYRSPPLQALLGFPGPSNLWAAPWVPSLTTIAGCHQGILFQIASFVVGTPSDWFNFCGLSSRGVVVQMQPVADPTWHALYAQRWPAFAECLEYQGAQDWCTLFKETLAGRLECTLEVFDREKKLGFAMAAMAARIQYEAPQPTLPAYPYRVLEGLEGLKVGMGVELQWKMQFGSPFGWWFGHLEEMLVEPGTNLCNATVTFRHFPATSRWYRLEVRIGDAELRPCSFGGFTGGLRPMSEDENAHWMRFFPKEPVVF